MKYFYWLEIRKSSYAGYCINSHHFSSPVCYFLLSQRFQNDLTLFNQLDSVEASLLNVLQKISDLKRIASDEALSMANAAYKIYDAANVSGISRAKQAYDKLKTRYDAQGTVGRKTSPELS